ncbi:MAG: helix-turn-helix transcriptional regulator [Hyphomonadaceae bacterium]|nr:helix-turn-helix transcriptional regulator [Hyphomonadaceae bacterium]
MKPTGVLPTERAEEASQLLKALASPHRLMIACRLAEGEETVGAIAAWLGVRETVVSQHLAVMRRERLVSPRREGQSIYYALRSDAARDVMAALARSFCAVEQVKEPRR